MNSSQIQKIVGVIVIIVAIALVARDKVNQAALANLLSNVSTSTSSVSTVSKVIATTPSTQPATVKKNLTPSSNVTTKTTKTTVVSNPTSTPAPVVNPPATAPDGYTLVQVATHNNSSSCWSVINANVYDLTSWIGEHPGGAQAIISICGKDGSAAFNDQHGGQRRPANELVGFKIGALI